ncbi:endospore germination permease [Paenibacillus sp. Marseille-Q4541]|uniref:GerAB/ArcD/ProY family transporter n=1 Tax=Paenibacillus sp. Marseille-Q4541 TaxID=2831522 RepID=UPI001BAAF9A1|nr:endospore germination permease [Paenibacillus sp. Marseille-Q4541]
MSVHQSSESNQSQNIKKPKSKPMTSRQLVLMILLITLPINLIHSPSDIVLFGRQHAYLCILIVYLVVIFSIWLLSRTQRRFGEKNIFQAMIIRFPVIGRMVVVLYILYYFFILTRDARIMSDYVDTTLLARTPIMVILFSIFIMSGYIIRGGMKSIVGMAEIFIPIMVLVILTLPFFVSGELDFHYLKPFFPVDIKRVAEGSWYYFSFAGEAVILPFILGKASFNMKAAMKGVSFSLLLCVMHVIMMILILGLPIIPRLTYPSFELVRQVQISDFLDRFDMFLAATMLPTHMTKIAFDIYVVCYGIGSLTKNMSGRMMQGPVILLAYVCAFWFFKDSVQVFNFDREWVLITLFFIFVMPVLIFLFVRPTKKKKKKKSEKTLGHTAGSASGT